MAEHGDEIEPKAESFMDKVSEKIHRDDSSSSSSSDNESDKKKKQPLHKDAPVTCLIIRSRSDDANILSTVIESFTKVEHIEDEEMEFTCHLDQIPLVCDFHLKIFDREEWSLASEALVSVDLLKDSFMSWVLILNVSCDVEVYDIAVGSFVFPKVLLIKDLKMFDKKAGWDTLNYPVICVGENTLNYSPL
ncbi:hypothetical protein Tco_0860843 [Tanacetum coccineum]|uniref:Uncharacterized protein n=1 Tax=Tanacetum coccineum TaxID=301880 RepID=A0ABQ5BJH5_9ASTR